MRYFKLINGEGWSDYKEGVIYEGNLHLVGDDVNLQFYATEGMNEADWEEVSEEEYLKQEGLQPNESTNIKPYYKGKSSLYLFAEEYGLNSWEFDICKRVIRCRHEGNWLEDLEKTKGVIDIYIKECKEKYNDMLSR